MKKTVFIALCFALQSGLQAGVQIHQPTQDSKKVVRPKTGFHDPFDKETGKSARKDPDPLEPMNRVFFTFNDRLYFWLLKPVATGLKTVVPKPCREAVGRVFVNARYPIRFVNNLLQCKLKNAGYETGRFVVNSTVGLGGLFDPATPMKLESHSAYLDQTLARYKIPTGCYFCWPIIGPSSVRATVGRAGDTMLTPWTYLGIPVVTYCIFPAESVNSTSMHLGEYEDLKNTTYDPYIAMRSAYFDSSKAN